MTMRHVFDDLFAAAGTTLDAHVTLHRETVLARHWWPDGSTLDLHADPRPAPPQSAPGAARAPRPTSAASPPAPPPLRGLRRARDAGPPPHLRRPRGACGRPPRPHPGDGPVSTLARSLARQFRDPRLRQLFGRYATYVGGSPFASPAVLALIWHAEAQGVWRVEGGMHRLARAMEAVAPPSASPSSTTPPPAGSRCSRAASPPSSSPAAPACPRPRRLQRRPPRARHRPPRRRRPPRGPAAAVEPRSLSANVWTFAARPRGPDLHHHNVFFGPDPRREFGPIAEGRLPEDPTLYICAQDRGTGRNPPELERFEIIMNAPPLRDGPPEDIDTCRTRTFRTLAGAWPDLRTGAVGRDADDARTASTPSFPGASDPSTGGARTA
jgi:1-hydroxycarotenoid 3,4-desaturase